MCCSNQTRRLDPTPPSSRIGFSRLVSRHCCLLVEIHPSPPQTDLERGQLGDGARHIIIIASVVRIHIRNECRRGERKPLPYLRDLDCVVEARRLRGVGSCWGAGQGLCLGSLSIHRANRSSETNQTLKLDPSNSSSNGCFYRSVQEYCRLPLTLSKQMDGI
jgi:hypothetical protein